MTEEQRYLDAQAAASLLGISVATLYAYVSRGLVRSEPGEGSSRARRYAREDIDALLTRKEYRREPARAAETALTYGMPVLDSAITLIDGGKLYYRGHDALKLAQERSFEEVATLLWTGNFEVDKTFGLTSPPYTGAAPLPDAEHPIEIYQATLALASIDDLYAHQLTPAVVAQTGVRILRLLTTATTGKPPAASVASSLQRHLAPDNDEATSPLSAALILCADHELNVSAFTARCVASAGSVPYAVVIAALAALQGHRHGGHTMRVAALFAEAANGVHSTIADYLKRGDPLPGFGHPLYPDGDPRARLLLAMLAERYPNHPAVTQVKALCTAVEDLLGLQPTIDFALVALAVALGAPRQSPLAIFALGRTAGWIAHAIEQYATGHLIRPRARYIGLSPR